MEFNLKSSIEILERTPVVLNSLLQNLSSQWVHENEGADTWSPYDIVGHLIHGEKTDWIPRTKLILAQKDEAFVPFDRFAQFENSKGKSLRELLAEFEKLRAANIKELRALNISEDQLDLKGTHPALGEVTLKNLLSTWVVHDLNHINQTSRVMAKNYKSEVGPWVEYLGVLNK
ncbi:DinB family protein [Fulvivirga sp. RKSG066]|uniref:DinB family protein n=1 Tax=Fulvivirga aurantia TaxID=2529383 RepID=UPI0012BD7462|nr:DinB family protein [Fulvivirga aurantia]MTI22819.1 DinB family protein [Fulvivirga aurantia]